jgi:hypothetical protein
LKGDVHAADISEWLHIPNLDHDGLSMVRANSHTGFENDIWSSLTAQLALALAFMARDRHR